MSSSNWFGKSNSAHKAEKPKFLASFGLKAKKPPASLAINNGHSPGTSPSASPANKPASPYSTRPPSKSVSSGDGSIGPRTPSDTNRVSVVTNNSLLTLSDADPFAARAITVASPATDRLSKYSNTSLPSDYHSKHHDSSYSTYSFNSSSSSYGGHHSPTSPLPKPQDVPTRSFPPARSASAKLTRKSSKEATLDSAWEARALGTIHQSKSPLDTRPGSSSQSSSERSHRRARGLTESSATRPNFLPGEIYMNSTPEKVSALRSAPVSPRVVVRQASHPRLAGPPDAPLPPPPVLDQPFNDSDPDPNISSRSASPFASSGRSNGRGVRGRNTRPMDQDESPDAATIMFANYKGNSDVDFSSWPYRTPSNSPAQSTLKKAISHQSLRKQPTTSSPLPSPAASTPPLTPAPDKSIRKQRSFHHPKIPLPPIPTALRTPGSCSSSPSPDVVPTESKRGSALSNSSGRKRLFSSSTLRRPSTASNSASFSTSADDDTRSLFSVRSDCDHRGPSQSVHSLLPDEFTLSERCLSSLSQPEYTPQQIISPADMFIIEASMQSTSPPPLGTRSRGLSTSTSQTEEGCASGTVLSPSNTSIRSSHSTSRASHSASTQLQNELALPRQMARTPHSFEDLPRHTDRVPSPPPQIVSLPPPPRPRRSTTSSSLSTHSFSSPSPPRTGLSPPPRRTPQSSMEKVLHRQSIMRKPSFLEIDDTDDSEEGVVDEPLVKADIDQLSNGTISSSFLDLARESFDTGR